MKKIVNWQVVLGLILIELSVIVFLVHYAIFRDAHHIFIYLLGDIGFVFIEVLMVTLIIHSLLNHREKQSMFKKLNMVIGAFFSEVGTELLKKIVPLDNCADRNREKLLIADDWSKKDFDERKKDFHEQKYSLDIDKADLGELKKILVQKRSFLLNLLENPNLLEHESFTDLLWAVFHLTEELEYRADLNKLTDKDKAHLCGDIKRAYKLLLLQWLSHIQHLKKDYPYLFSLARRTNPFDLHASVEIK